MICPNCKAEYREGFTRCNDCDVYLVNSLPEIKETSVEEPQVTKEDINEDLTFVPVLSTFNLGDIALLKSIMDDQGIEYFLQGENTSYIRAYMDPTILMVREDQVEITKELLKDFDLKFTVFGTNNKDPE
jgi:hypothetical protein